MGWEFGRVWDNIGNGWDNFTEDAGTVVLGTTFLIGDGIVDMLGGEVTIEEGSAKDLIYKDYQEIMESAGETIDDVVEVAAPIVTTVGDVALDVSQYTAAYAVGWIPRAYEIHTGEDLSDSKYFYWAGDLSDKNEEIGEFIRFTVTQPGDSLPYIAQGGANAIGTTFGLAGDLVQGVTNLAENIGTAVYNVGVEEEEKRSYDAFQWGEGAFDLTQMGEQAVHFIDVQDVIKDEKTGEYVENPYADYQRTLLYGTQAITEVAVFWGVGGAISGTVRGTVHATKKSQTVASTYKATDMAGKLTKATERVAKASDDVAKAQDDVRAATQAAQKSADDIAKAKDELKALQESAEASADDIALAQKELEALEQAGEATAKELADAAKKVAEAEKKLRQAEKALERVQRDAQITTGSRDGAPPTQQQTTANTADDAANAGQDAAEETAEEVAAVLTRRQAFAEGFEIGRYNTRHIFDPRYSPILETTLALGIAGLGVHVDQIAAEDRASKIKDAAEKSSNNTDMPSVGDRDANTEELRRRLQEQQNGGEIENTRPQFNDAVNADSPENTTTNMFNKRTTNQIDRLPEGTVFNIRIEPEASAEIENAPEEVETVNRTIKSI